MLRWPLKQGNGIIFLCWGGPFLLPARVSRRCAVSQRPRWPARYAGQDKPSMLAVAVGPSLAGAVAMAGNYGLQWTHCPC
ncbi:hypothetical protein GQ53DRAFT_537281 [Thozetella sp. PMI_491]|nr:hypothetical protein GQ53DRAFT_537281 [Thozetella sp. PMI_491]